MANNNKTVITIDGEAGGKITSLLWIGVVLIFLLAFNLAQGFYTKEQIKDLKTQIKLLDDTLLTKGYRGNDTQTKNNHH